MLLRDPPSPRSIPIHGLLRQAGDVVLPLEILERDVDLEGLEVPGPELGAHQAVQPEPVDGLRLRDLLHARAQLLREPGADVGDGGFHGREVRARGRQIVLAVFLRHAGRFEGFGPRRGQDAGPWVAVAGEWGIEAGDLGVVGIVGLEAREDVGLVHAVGGGVVVIGGGREGNIHDLQEFLLVQGGDAGAAQDPLDLRVLVQVADVGDHAEADRRGRQALGAAVAGEHVEEEVAGAVVRLGGLADAAGDGGGHEEEIELVVLALDGPMQVEGAEHLGVDAGVPHVAWHLGKECFLCDGSVIDSSR